MPGWMNHKLVSRLKSEVAQSCPTLCDPMDSSLHQVPPSMGFSRQEYWSGLTFPSPENLPAPGIKPGYPKLWKWKWSRSVVSDALGTPWTVAYQASPSMGFSRQEYWSRLLSPPPGDLPDPGIKPASLMSSAVAGESSTTGATWEVLINVQLLTVMEQSGP